MIQLLKQYIKKSSTVIIGVSGGPDSIYLLDLCKNLPVKIIIAHVNHNLRGKNSDEDRKFVKKLSKKLNFPLETIKLEKLPRGNLEENCRNARYKFFEEIRKKHKADWILTAHHLNDNIETVMLNLTRGSFIDGLSGMSPVDKKRHILRPLLFTSKSEILQYLKKNSLKFREDESNNDLKFSRNLIRHKVIPPLKTINQNLEQTLKQNIKNLQELKSFLDNLSNDWIQKNSTKTGIKLGNFLKLEPLLQTNILFSLYKKTYGNTKNFSRSHLEQILAILKQNRANRKKEFGNSHYIAISRPQNNPDKYIQILKK